MPVPSPDPGFLRRIEGEGADHADLATGCFALNGLGRPRDGGDGADTGRGFFRLLRVLILRLFGWRRFGFDNVVRGDGLIIVMAIVLVLVLVLVAVVIVVGLLMRSSGSGC